MKTTDMACQAQAEADGAGAAPTADNNPLSTSADAPAGPAVPAERAERAERRGRRAQALYRKFLHEAYRKLQTEEYLELRRAWADTDYETTYGVSHGIPGFQPAVERQLGDEAAMNALESIRPLDESVLSLWYCRQRRGAAQGGQQGHDLVRVSPAHSTTAPFRRTSAFTTPTHLSLHASPVEVPRPRVRTEPLFVLQPDLDDVRHYPLADVFQNVGTKYWCDRQDDPIDGVDPPTRR